MTTPHIAAEPGQIAPRVIMPGDPRRARRIAESILDDAELVTDLRGILGFTGTYRGEPLSVLASGMGSPSITIYATELARFFGVRQIVRIGTAGAIRDDVRVRDVVVATAAHTDSAMTVGRIPGISFSHVPDFDLARRAVEFAQQVPGERDASRVHAAPVFTSDHFYHERPGLFAALAAHGTAAVEMEAAALYAVGAAEGVETLAVVTISDHILSGEELPAAERETAFHDALEIVLAALHTPAQEVGVEPDA